MPIASMANATWSSYTPKTGADGSGDPTYGSPVALSVRALLFGVTSKQRFTLGSTIKDATAVMNVEKFDVPAGVAIAVGGLVTTAVDGSAAIEQRVEYVNDNQKDGGDAYFEVFLKAI